MTDSAGQPQGHGAIGSQELAVARALLAADPAWLTAAQVAERSGVPGRTVRHHLTRLAGLALVEVAAVLPGPRYRLTPGPQRPDYLARLDAAAEVLGLPAVSCL